MSLPILSPDESARWDHRAEQAGMALETLMDAAGRAAAQVLAARFGHRTGGGVLVAVGPGNNGGDGWVLARALHRLGVPVFVAPAPGERSSLNQRAALRAQAEGIRTVEPDGPWPQAQVAVDALLGTGARGVLRPPIRALVERLNDLAVPILAIDGPTGVDLGTGASHGVLVRAELSVTFGGLRRGHLLAREECGGVVVVDIGHPDPDPAWPVLFTEAEAARTQDRFGTRDHKGHRGRIVVVGGEAGMSGALRLAARAAFAGGAGLVHAVAPDATIDALLAAEPDLQTLRHDFTAPLAPALLALLGQADAVVIGPGLGRGAGRREFVAALATASAPAPLVLDADALNAFADALPDLARLVAGRPALLTPHIGEFRRLFPDLGKGLEADPWTAASAAAAQAGCAVLLKGVPTVVGHVQGAPLTIAAGNPGLATGGSGDILSGLAGTALAQVQHPAAAAALAALALGRAAEHAARRVTARALRPMDVLAALPELWRAWEVLRTTSAVPRPPILLELEAPQRW
ncbi:MAG: NAD(P)H-hydrate dehydratase [Gemmatimonadales bacterium]|nr:NAD(P)H-hydrate dehydratase [Gemmatimonadales bacterium]